ncbi:MAG: response regulator [Jannaschia sp.]
MTEMTPDDLATKVGNNLPFLRRYARALTGSQSSGDKYAIAALETILEDPSIFDGDLDAKSSLFKVFHSIWITSGATVEPSPEAGGGLVARAYDYLSGLTANTREALLLHTIEEFDHDQIASIMGIDAGEARDLVDIAYAEMSRSVSGKVLVIEDEAIIAMDIEAIVTGMGHQVTGVARTEAEALNLAASQNPDLILSDIQLADDSSGIDAVNRILADAPDVPVIFITAFPERLLTGEGPEPAFLISKPYTEDQVRSAVSQAMFFSSTETLKA